MPELPDNNADEARRWMRNVEEDLHAWAVDGRYGDDVRDEDREQAVLFAALAEDVVSRERSELGEPPGEE